jgi:hypothetical protein
MLPEKVLARMRDSNGSWFSTGDTIRKKDLTLAFAPLEHVEARKRSIRQQQTANESVFRGGVDMGQGVKTDKETGVTTEVVKGEASEKFT